MPLSARGKMLQVPIKRYRSPPGVMSCDLARALSVGCIANQVDLDGQDYLFNISFLTFASILCSRAKCTIYIHIQGGRPTCIGGFNRNHHYKWKANWLAFLHVQRPGNKREEGERRRRSLLIYNISLLDDQISYPLSNSIHHLLISFYPEDASAKVPPYHDLRRCFYSHEFPKPDRKKERKK